MTLRHQSSTQKTESWWRQEQQEQEKVTSLTPTETRIDIDTAQSVIARAAELQTAHRQTLSVADLEKLAQEVGVENTFVQQALDEHAQVRASGSQSATTTKPRSHGTFPVVAQRITLALVSSLYALLVLNELTASPKPSFLFIALMSTALGAICGVITQVGRRATKYGAILGMSGVAVLAYLGNAGRLQMNGAVVLGAVLLVLMGIAGANFGKALVECYHQELEKASGPSHKDELG